MLLSCDAKANASTTNLSVSAEPTKPSNQRINSLEPSFNEDSNTLTANQQSTKRKISSHGLNTRDNDFIYDPQIRPHRQGIFLEYSFLCNILQILPEPSFAKWDGVNQKI